uniref:Uncharacterized protein n=1 Tax=Solanum lycopersicum TaxID=4081 RepID=K4AVI9_SOLLC
MVHVLGDAEAKAVALKTQMDKSENHCEDLESTAEKLNLQKKVGTRRHKWSSGLLHNAKPSSNFSIVKS